MDNSPTSHKYISQRLRLHYSEWGDADAPVLLLLHGLHDHSRTWDRVAQEFAINCRVIAPDLRGHGDSDWVLGSGYDYLDYLYDVHQLIRQLGIGRVVLVGHSLGGAIAAQFAAVYPEHVERLVLIEALGIWEEGDTSAVHMRVRQWIESTHALAARHPRRYATMAQALARMRQANPNLSDEQSDHLTRHGVLQNEDGTYSWKYDNYTYNFAPGGFSRDDLTALWQRIQCPVLIINANDGLPFRIGHDDTLMFLADARVHVLSPAGHWVYHDRPDETVALIRKFL